MGSVDETSTSEGDGRKYQVKHQSKPKKLDISMTLGNTEFGNQSSQRMVLDAWIFIDKSVSHRKHSFSSSLFSH
ncbi:MAG: hypothetical protein ACFFAZ_10175 [Promethearchaeota archaeon]